jgi:hypothetical protein
MIRFVQIVQAFNARVTTLRMIQRSAYPMFPQTELLSKFDIMAGVSRLV